MPHLVTGDARRTISPDSEPRSAPDPRDVQLFVAQLGAAMSAAGEPVYSVQERLQRVAHAYGGRSARISAFPTYLMVSMGRGEPATLELTAPMATPRLDQIAAIDHLVTEAERGEVDPVDGLHQLDAIADMHSRFGRLQSIAGYAVFTTGISLILHPSGSEVATAAVLGAVVGALRTVGRREPAQILMPLVAAFCVSALSALAVRWDINDAGLRPMVASLVVFLPGAALTTSVLEVAAGQMISGASRLVSGFMQLGMLAFGIVAGIEAIGVPSALVFAGTADSVGEWAAWFGVLVFAIGVFVANAAPKRSFPTLLLVLYAAWIGQVLGNQLIGGYVSAFAGALLMTPVAFWVSRLPSAMPQHASFLPGFWLLVPGSLSLIGIAELAAPGRGAGAQDLVAAVVSMFAVAVGVLTGTLLVAWSEATGRAVKRRSWRKH